MRYCRNILLVVVILFLGARATGQQVPFGINYQAVARDSYGNELINEQIDIRFTVVSGTPLGNVEYQEIHSIVSTTKYGVFSVIIGMGTTIMGSCETFSDISWESGAHFLKVEIKFKNDYLDMGTMQFLSVPYALYARKSLEPGPEGPAGASGPQGMQGVQGDQGVVGPAGVKGDKGDTGSQGIQGEQGLAGLKGDAGDTGPVGLQGEKGDPGDPASDNQRLSFDGLNLMIDDGAVSPTTLSTVNLAALANNTDDEIQYLSLKDDTLSITKGNFVTFSKLDVDDADADPENEIQDLRLTDDKLKVTLNTEALEIDLSPYLDNTDNQSLTFSNSDSTISISDGTGIDLSNVLWDADVSATNEIQDLDLTEDVLSISNSSQSGINLSSYLDNTDNQTLSFNDSDSTIAITLGNNINLSDVLRDADVDITNEIQDLSLTDNKLKVTNNTAATEIDLSPYLDNTDEQELSYDPVTYILTIANGSSSIDLSGLKDDDDADAGNELITYFSIDGTELIIREGTNEKSVDLSGNIIAFRAEKNLSTTGLDMLTDYDFIANNTLYNDGSDYNNSTGEFAAPLDGIYTFNVGYYADGSGDSRELSLFLNGTKYETLQSGISGGMSVLKSITMKLSANDIVKIIFNTGLSEESGTGTFSGFRVY